MNKSWIMFETDSYGSFLLDILKVVNDELQHVKKWDISVLIMFNVQSTHPNVNGIPMSIVHFFWEWDFSYRMNPQF